MVLQARASQFRAALDARDRAALDAILAAFGQARDALDADLRALTRQVVAAREAGRDVSLDWLRRQDRYVTLIAQVEREIDRAAAVAEATIRQGQEAAVLAGVEDAGALLAEAGVATAFDRLPVQALGELVGTLGNGSPLRALLDDLGPEASAGIREALVSGLARGLGADDLARAIRGDLGGSAVRAMRISRTEVTRAYRTASLTTYRAHGDALAGWRWLSAKGTRTCAVCWAMDGTEHDLDEPFASHVACRCAILPLLRDGAEPMERGEVAFRRLGAADQRAILGNGVFDLYRRGELRLADLVEETSDPAWGPGRRERTLSELGRREQAAD